MIDFDAAREHMVESQLMTSGVTERRLLRAMGQIPRERFVPAGRKDLAYIDEAHVLRTGADPRAMATPAAFAKLVQLADIGAGDVVLDIACGTGYSSAVIAALSSAVVAIEDDEQLVASADEILSDLDIGNAAILCAPLAGGVPAEAPFDVIIIEGAVDIVPEALLSQLKEQGRLVAMVGSGSTAVANLFVNAGGSIRAYPAFNAAMPVLSAFRKAPEFSF
jgi:protein-L-isoaspartate(D-aspartate) O-methyltransferase